MKLLSTLSILFISGTLTACTTLKEEGADAVVSNLGGTRFYSLSSLPPNPASHSSLRLGIGPLKIPRLLNRPQIVSRKNSNEINMAELHQWGGSYEEELLQVMTDNLSTLLETNHIEQYPWKLSFKPNYQIRINIERFDGELGKNIVLKARWRLLRHNKELLVKQTLINMPTHTKTYGDYVKAQSKALQLFSQQIKTEIKKLM